MISVITYGELIHGAKKSRDIQKNTATVRRISELFPVVEVTKAIMETFGDIKAVLQRQGNIIDDMDLIIAATAITMNYTLVTNNESHFSRVSDLRIENWAVK
jgi:tRNA(fMet)-specific endonuclease VapC